MPNLLNASLSARIPKPSSITPFSSKPSISLYRCLESCNGPTQRRDHGLHSLHFYFCFSTIPKWLKIFFKARMPLHEAFTDCIT